MTSFTFAMPSGIPGAVNRVGGGYAPDIEAIQQDHTNPLVSYGFAGVVDAVNGTLRLPTAGDAGTAIYGFLVRPFPQQALTAAGFSGTSALGAGTPPGADKIVDVLRKGFITVTLAGATAAVKGQPVFVRIDATASGKGSVEAAAGANLVSTAWLFMGPADANGNVEIGLV